MGIAEAKMRLEYEVAVVNLDSVTAQANGAAKSAEAASKQLNSVKTQSNQTIPILMQSVGAINNARQAVVQLSSAFKNLDPFLMLSAMINMIQVSSNLTHLMKMLQTSTAGASAAQAILATLTGKWWIIPLALIAGALVYSRIQSYQAGGPISETGLYMLHKGEYVVPANQVNRYGPIYVVINESAKSPIETDPRRLLSIISPEIISATRRGG